MSPTRCTFLTLIAMLSGCSTATEVEALYGGSTLRTGVGGGDSSPDEPAIGVDDVCAPALSVDDPEELDHENVVAQVPGLLEARVTVLTPPDFSSSSDLSISLELLMLEPSLLFHEVEGLRVPYTLDFTERVFDRAASYLAVDEKITEWAIDRTYDGLSMECDMVYEAAQQQFIKTCAKAVQKSFTAELLGQEAVQANLGSTLQSKPQSELKASIKAWDLTVTYVYDLYGDQSGDPSFSIKPQAALDLLSDGLVDTPVEYELSLTTSEILPGCISVKATYEQSLDGEAEAGFWLQWAFDFN